MTVLAIIPARGGSKGVPRKNLRTVGGVSLLERAIASVKAAGVADTVLVSTEDPEIKEVALAAGADVPFDRPADLADDTAATVDVVRHVLDGLHELGRASPEILVLAEPTLPFRSPASVRAAVERCARGDVASVVSVCPLERKPQYIFRKEGGLVARYIQTPNETFARRQDMRHLCRLSSVVWVVRTERFRAAGRLMVEPTGFVETDPVESVNIDEPLDLDFADFLARRDGI
jgi:CMP-N-acetylneuraminic acid synthetase